MAAQSTTPSQPVTRQFNTTTTAESELKKAIDGCTELTNWIRRNQAQPTGQAQTESQAQTNPDTAKFSPKSWAGLF